MSKAISGPDIRSFSDFLVRLRAFESGIDLERHSWYVENLDNTFITWVAVDAPGRVRRDFLTGRHIVREVTVRQYFDAVGVLDFFDAENPRCLSSMQYQVVNPWGYVGYQFGEHILLDTGYYIPEKRICDVNGQAAECDVYYRGVPDVSIWSSGIQEKLIWYTEITAPVLVTDVNRWKGRFVGKDGISSFADLKTDWAQEILIREIMKSNLNTLRGGLEACGQTLETFLSMSWPISDHNSVLKTVGCTLSGLLACCHLCGAQATLDLLLERHMVEDELGTPILDYMIRFGGFDISELLEEKEGR